MEQLEVRMKLSESQSRLVEEALRSLAVTTKGEKHEELLKLSKMVRDQFNNAVYIKQVNQPYLDRGYSDREAYLRSLANDYDLSVDYVFSVAEELGESEDFEELPRMLERASSDDDGDDD